MCEIWVLGFGFMASSTWGNEGQNGPGDLSIAPKNEKLVIRIPLRPEYNPQIEEKS